MESAYNATSCAMVLTYWNVGRRIVEQEQDGNQRAEYGTAMMDALAAELTTEYRNRKRICFAARQQHVVTETFYRPIQHPLQIEEAVKVNGAVLFVVNATAPAS